MPESLPSRDRISAPPDLRDRLIPLVVEHGFTRLRMDVLLRELDMDEDLFRLRHGSLEDCCLEALFAVWDEFEAEVVEEFEAAEGWRRQLRSGAFAAAAWVHDHPREAKFAFLEALRAGGRLQAEREQLIEGLVDLVDRGRSYMGDPEAHGREIAVAVVGGAIGLLVQELEREREAVRPEVFVPEFMFMAVLPYLGEDAAHEELSQSSPAGPRG